MKNKIFFILFILLWALLVIFNIFAPKETFSEQENKVLAKIPKFSLQDFMNGEFLKEVDNYINDHFIFRNTFLKINSWWETKVMKKQENNGIYIGKDGYLFEKFIYSTQEEENVEIAVNRIENFTKKVEVPVYFLLVPNSIAINYEKLPDNAEVQSQKEIIEEIYKKISTKNIEVYRILAENKNLDLYFKTDHHMTSDAAYLVYLEYCKTVGIEAETIEKFKRICIADDFLGTFDSKAQIPNQEKDKIVVYENEKNTKLQEVIFEDTVSKTMYNKEYLTKKDKYSYFLNGNHSKVVIKTNVKNGKKLLVIKDSYAHILAPFLVQNYEEVHLLDPRYYRVEISSYVKEKGITEVLFLYNLANFVQDVGIRNLK